MSDGMQKLRDAGARARARREAKKEAEGEFPLEALKRVPVGAFCLSNSLTHDGYPKSELSHVEILLTTKNLYEFSSKYTAEKFLTELIKKNQTLVSKK